jgi:hypothetical protein
MCWTCTVRRSKPYWRAGRVCSAKRHLRAFRGNGLCQTMPAGALETQVANEGFGGSLCREAGVRNQGSRIRGEVQSFREYSFVCRMEVRFVATAGFRRKSRKANGDRLIGNTGFVCRTKRRFVAATSLRRTRGVTVGVRRIRRQESGIGVSESKAWFGWDWVRVDASAGEFGRI